MILIQKNTTNKAVFTLSEKTTLQNAVYLFEVTNDETNNVVCFIAEDISPNPVRYNEFNLIENATPDLLNGIFTLPLTGYHKYKVYEQVSSTNLDPLQALNLIENGKLKVTDVVIENSTYTGNPQNIVVYGR